MAKHVMATTRAESSRTSSMWTETNRLGRWSSGRHKTRLTLCRLMVRTLAADDSVGLTGKHVCAESDSASTLCVSRVERAWLLLGLDDRCREPRAHRWAVVGATHCLEVCRPANQLVHNALSGTDDEHDSDRAGEDGATMVQPISQDAVAPFQGAHLPFCNCAAAPS